MATEQKGFSVGTQLATASLTTAQFVAVKLDSAAGVIICSASGEKIFGILQDKPAAGAVCEVCTLGVTKAKAGAVVAAGALIMTNASGRVITAATTGSTIIGWALSAAGADGDIITVYLHPGLGVV